MKEHIHLIAHIGVDHFSLHHIAMAAIDTQVHIIVIDHINDEKKKQESITPFSPEPFVITALDRFNEPLIISEIPRNKYFDKPKNNYKKR